MQQLRTKGRGTPRHGLVLMALSMATAGCELEWGGAYLALEDPSPPPDSSEIVMEPLPEEPLPAGPFVYVAHVQPSGSAVVVPVARLSAATVEPLGLPAALSEEYRARFDSTFYSPGRELTLQSGGQRIGTLVIEAPIPSTDASCPSLARATALLRPGQTVAPLVFALPPEATSTSSPERVDLEEPTRSMVIAGPVLAERLIDDERSFLAQRQAIRSVPAPENSLAPEDSLPWMAATYLVSDTLAAVPPSGNAISLFFLARYQPGRGYSSIWQELRRYDTADRKEAFEYLDWLSTTSGRLDLLRRYGGDRVGIVASLHPMDGGAEAERTIGFTEAGTCRALELLER